MNQPRHAQTLLSATVRLKADEIAEGQMPVILLPRRSRIEGGGVTVVSPFPAGVRIKLFSEKKLDEIPIWVSPDLSEIPGATMPPLPWLWTGEPVRLQVEADALTSGEMLVHFWFTSEGRISETFN